MLDSGVVPLTVAEWYLHAIGPMDAVGFHPYVYDLTTMEQETQTLRTWLDANGHQGVPLDINEFSSGDGFSTSISSWGAQVATFTSWALCTPGLAVENVQPFWWGAVPGADTNFWYSMFGSELTSTPLGGAYLAQVSTLTHSGCPVVPVVRPPTNPTKPPTKPKADGRKTRKVTVTLALRKLFWGASPRLSRAGTRVLRNLSPALMRSKTVSVNAYATKLSLGWARDTAISNLLFKRAPRGMEMTFASHLAKRKNERVLIRYTRIVARR